MLLLPTVLNKFESLADSHEVRVAFEVLVSLYSVQTIHHIPRTLLNHYNLADRLAAVFGT